jgi:hypothetical protein
MLFLLPPAMYLLKQALALMTALHESLSTSQGPSAKTETMKAVRIPIDTLILY